MKYASKALLVTVEERIYNDDDDNDNKRVRPSFHQSGGQMRGSGPTSKLDDALHANVVSGSTDFG